MATVHLVDASPYLFRAFFALPESIRDPAGRPVNAVHGFVQFLLDVLDGEGVTHLGVCFDASLTTSYRNEIDPAYKTNRETPPEALEAQIPDAREAVEALGGAIFVLDRYEAEDLMAALAAPLVATGHQVVLLSSDKDLCQLVGPGVELLDIDKGERYDAGAVIDRMGVGPELVPDLLGLAGDPVDGIPGVSGVGRKTAVALLGSLGGLDAIYARLDEVEGLAIRGAKRVRRLLEEGRDAAFRSRRVATITDDAPVAASLADLALQRPDRARIEALCARLGFGGLRERMLARAD